MQSHTGMNKISADLSVTAEPRNDKTSQYLHNGTSVILYSLFKQTVKMMQKQELRVRIISGKIMQQGWIDIAKEFASSNELKKK